MGGDVVGGGFGVSGDPLASANEVGLEGLIPWALAGGAVVGGVALDGFEVPHACEVAVVLGPFELLEKEGLGVAAVGASEVETVLGSGEVVGPDGSGLDGGGGGEAGLGDFAVEIQTRHGELEGGGFEGGVVGPLVDLVGEEVADRAGGKVAFGTCSDELEGARREVHLGFSEVVVVGGEEGLEGAAGAEAGMELALGPGLCVFVGAGHIEDGAGVLGDGPHEAVREPGGAADLGGLHKGELADFWIREPKVKLPEVWGVVGVVAAGSRGEAFVEGDIFLCPLEGGRPKAGLPDARELLASCGIKKRGHRG